MKNNCINCGEEIHLQFDSCENCGKLSFEYIKDDPMDKVVELNEPKNQFTYNIIDYPEDQLSLMDSLRKRTEQIKGNNLETVLEILCDEIEKRFKNE